MNAKLKVLTAGVVFFFGQTAIAQQNAGDTTRVEKIEEVVIVAYGSQKKATLTGSVGTIKADDLAKVTNANVVQGAVGKIAGVQVYAGSGQPGQAPSVRFRGIGSVNGNSNPLYVVDGVPYSGSITAINNNDIESMSFLKDASLAALYGNRGANGVIIITTKKGRTGKPRVSLDLKTGINVNGNRQYKLINNYANYYEAYYQGLVNNYVIGQGLSQQVAQTLAATEIIDGAQGLGYNIFDVANTQLIDPNTGKVTSSKLKYTPENWEDFLFREGFYTSSFVNVNGGSDATKYYFSAGYEKNEGYGINSRFDKLTARLKVDSKISDRFTLGGNIAYTNAVLDNPDGNGDGTFSSPYRWINTIGPIYGVYQRDNNGNIVNDSQGNPTYDTGDGAGAGYAIRPYGQLQNPYITALQDLKRTNRNSVFMNAYLDVNILKGLNFKYSITGDFTNSDYVGRDSAFYGDAVGAGGRLTAQMTNVLGITNQQLLNYDFKLGSSHTFNILAGHETYELRSSYVSASRSKLFLPETDILDIGSVYQGSSGGKNKYATEGYFGRVNYEYDNKYYLSANVRRDASSYFHPDNRWGNFYGAGAAWRVSKENFLKDSKVIDELKLKASYGEQGNDDLNFPVDTPYQLHYNVTQEVSDTGGAIGFTRFYNGKKDITWEKQKNLSTGFELSLFNRRVSIEAEYFERKVRDMLFSRPLGPFNSGGFDSEPKNIGSMQNKGVEVTVDVSVVKKENFSLNLRGNATHYKNELTELYDNKEMITSPRFLKVGYDIYTYRMREFAGVNASNGNATWYVDTKDANGNVTGKTVTETYLDATLYVIDKTATPDVYGGFGLDSKFGNFDLAVDFAYQLGGWGYDTNYMSRLSGGLGESIHEDYYNTWMPSNTNAVLPKFVVDDPKFSYSQSTLGLIKSDYLSIQNITLGYSINRDLLSGAGISGARLYFSVNNPVLLSKRTGYDPRLSVSGSMGQATYSINRTFVFGANISF